MPRNHRRVQRPVNLLDTFSSLRNEIIDQLQKPSASTDISTQLREHEREIIRIIRMETKQANRNNITRTSAYLQFFLQYPEIHWALLAHMVSRNGGWNMTDLKGEMLFNLLEGRETRDFFTFLDRSNHYIFQDAYPQLLLYRESKKHGRNMSHLLSAFHVSRFIKPFWDFHWKHQNDPELFNLATHMLTWALIINEQQYIQKRIIEDSYFKQNVLQTWEFRLQSVLPLNLVLFPFNEHDRTRKGGTTVDVTGVIIRRFPSLRQRIKAGKTLYQLLFPGMFVHRGIWSWLIRNPHTASRADYWPHLFCVNPETAATKIYSPQLQQAWQDIPHPKPERRDWFDKTDIFSFFTTESADIDRSRADVHQLVAKFLKKGSKLEQYFMPTGKNK